MRTLSRIAGVSPSTVGEIERGNRASLSSDTAKSITDACGLSLDWLLSGKGTAPDPQASAAMIRAGWAKLPPKAKSGPKGKAAPT
jgi:transcriptional regulator with XRE-family HTH domain